MVVSAASIALPLLAQGLFGPVASAQTTKPAAAASAKAAASAAPSATPAGTAPASSAAPASSTTPASASSAGTPAVVQVDMNAKPADTGMNGATYAVRLRDLEQRVDELKDQIRRSHTRLALLSDTIIGGGAAGSRAEVSSRTRCRTPSS